jgi:arginyl-tRNA synthetase
MNIFAIFHDRIAAILADFAEAGRLPRDLDLARFVVEPPRDPSHGDLAVNAAMVFAKEAKAHFNSPRQFATEIAMALALDEDVAEAEVAGPGFINIRLRPHMFGRVLQAVLKSGADYGRPIAARSSASGAVNVEYVSANPTGPMHVGHGRGAVFGDALANLLAFAGHNVTREYYINDAGAQVDVLARSAHLRYREALGETIGEIPEGLYPGDYLKPVGKALAAEYGDKLVGKPGERVAGEVRAAAIAAMMDMIRGDLAAIAISTRCSSRSARSRKARRATWWRPPSPRCATGRLVYEGRLPPPKGAPVEDYEDREQTCSAPRNSATTSTGR